MERTQIIMGCAGPREDVSCSIITTAGQGKRVNRMEDIGHCIPSPKRLQKWSRSHTFVPMNFPAWALIGLQECLWFGTTFKQCVVLTMSSVDYLRSDKGMASVKNAPGILNSVLPLQRQRNAMFKWLKVGQACLGRSDWETELLLREGRKAIDY